MIIFNLQINDITMEFLKPIKIISSLNRKKQDPGKFVFTGIVNVDEPEIQLFEYNDKICNETKNIAIESIKRFEANDINHWLNIYGLNKTEIIASICERQGIHSLVIQDILDVNQRPKFQEYDSFSFLTLRSIMPSNDEMIADQISFVFGSNYLISFQERKADLFEHIRFRLREDKGLIRERGADYLLYSMLESILDNYFKVLGRLEEEINKISFTDINKEPSPNLLAILEKYKKFVHFIQKSIFPIKEFSQMVERGESQYIEKRHLKYFLEIKDLCLTLLDSCEILHASLESQTNLFFSVQGHRMNQVMKTLTIVATIFIPLTFIVGVYGMNFINMPELEWRYGYAAVWLLIIFVFGGMLFYFRRRKWF